LPRRGFLDVAAVVLDPVAVAEVELAADGLDGDLALVDGLLVAGERGLDGDGGVISP
jgi:hypothetical protein